MDVMLGKYTVNPVSLRGMKSRSNLSFWDCHACLRQARNDKGGNFPHPTTFGGKYQRIC